MLNYFRIMFIVSLVEDAVWQDFLFLPCSFLKNCFPFCSFYFFSIYLLGINLSRPAQATILAFLVAGIERHELIAFLNRVDVYFIFTVFA